MFLLIYIIPIVQVEEEQDDEGRQADGQGGAEGVDPDLVAAAAPRGLIFVFVIVPVLVQVGPVFGALFRRRLSLWRAVGVTVTAVGVTVTAVGVVMTTMGVTMASVSVAVTTG